MAPDFNQTSVEVYDLRKQMVPPSKWSLDGRLNSTRQKATMNPKLYLCEAASYETRSLHTTDSS